MREGLGSEFVEEVDAALDRIAYMPEMYALHWEEVRSCRVRRFPYLIHFRILSDRIEVFAVIHGKQESAVWKRRL